jgi:ribosomal protein L15
MKNLVALKNRRVKRVGRGQGSGCGKTARRGMNGQKAKGVVSRCFANIWRLSHGKRGMKSAKKNYNRTFVISTSMIGNKKLPKKPDFKSLAQLFDVPHYCRQIKIIGSGEKNQTFLRKKVASKV